MKKIIISSTICVLSITGALFYNQQPLKDKVIDTNISANIIKPEIIPQQPIDITPAVVEPNIIETPTITSEQVQAPVTKTTNDYVNEYFGSTFITEHFKVDNANDNVLLQSKLIDNVMLIVNANPDRFTTDKADESFKYLHYYFSRVWNINPNYAINNFTWQ